MADSELRAKFSSSYVRATAVQALHDTLAAAEKAAASKLPRGAVLLCDTKPAMQQTRQLVAAQQELRGSSRAHQKPLQITLTTAVPPHMAATPVGRKATKPGLARVYKAPMKVQAAQAALQQMFSPVRFEHSPPPKPIRTAPAVGMTQQDAADAMVWEQPQQLQPASGAEAATQPSSFLGQLFDQPAAAAPAAAAGMMPDALAAGMPAVMPAAQQQQPAAGGFSAMLDGGAAAPEDDAWDVEEL